VREPHQGEGDLQPEAQAIGPVTSRVRGVKLPCSSVTEIVANLGSINHINPIRPDLHVISHLSHCETNRSGEILEDVFC
jgi:hypothetical protein